MTMTFYAVAAVKRSHPDSKGDYRIDFFTVQNAYDETDAHTFLTHLSPTKKREHQIAELSDLVFLKKAEYDLLRAQITPENSYISGPGEFHARMDTQISSVQRECRETRIEISEETLV